MKQFLSGPRWATRLALFVLVAYPQTGLWAGPGTVRLQGVEFLNLYQGGVQQAQQPNAGETKGNTFVNCRTGLFFRNAAGAGPVGRAVLTCNSFQQPTNVAIAECFGIYLGPGPYVAGQAGQQINISTLPPPTPGATPPPILQTSRFVGPLPAPRTVPTFWHVYNDGGNARLDYTHYQQPGGGGGRVPNDALVVGDSVNRVSVVRLVLGGNSQNPPNYIGSITCAALGYPAGIGLRSAATSNPPAPTSPYFLAQNAPNPCSGSTSVSYRLPASSGKAELVIRDVFSGRVWQRTPLQTGERTVEIQVHTLPPGAYHYSLEISGASVAHHQLLVH